MGLQDGLSKNLEKMEVITSVFSRSCDKWSCDCENGMVLSKSQDKLSFDLDITNDPPYLVTGISLKIQICKKTTVVPAMAMQWIWSKYCTVQRYGSTLPACYWYGALDCNELPVLTVSYLAHNWLWFVIWSEHTTNNSSHCSRPCVTSRLRNTLPMYLPQWQLWFSFLTRVCSQFHVSR